LQPEVPGEPPHITVEFDVDMNGILNVSAVDRGSQQAKQTTLRAAHARLNTAAKEASARYLSELWEASAAETTDDDPLLAQARGLLDREIEEASALADLVARYEAARRADDETEAERLREELVDALYDLDAEGAEIEDDEDGTD